MSPLEWLAANGHDTAGVTGTDSKSLTAIAACWALYAYTNSDLVVEAVAKLLRSVQRVHWVFAVELVAKELDWGDRERVAHKLAFFIADSASARALAFQALTSGLVMR